MKDKFIVPIKYVTDVTNKEFKDFREYRKISITKARKMKQNFVVQTKEGLMSGKKGDYLAEGINGERYPIDKEIFKKSYELIKEKS